MAMMTDKISRREFVVTTAAGVVAATAGTHTEAPAIMTQARVQPVVVASANGHQFKNGGAKTAVEQAFAMMTSGTDVLESLIAGVTIVELDPEETSVGYGGLPNADGVVQLDSCCMHGPLRRFHSSHVLRERSVLRSSSILKPMPRANSCAPLPAIR